MPATSHQHCATKLRQAELDYDREQLRIKVEADELRITAEQSLPYVAVCEALDDDAPRCKAFFIESAGGCGKTFLLTLILNKVRSAGHILPLPWRHPV